MENRNKIPSPVFEIVRDMKIGWNLGNSLESPAPESVNPKLNEYETSWGNPITTKAMIREVVRAGFRVIRIPVTWGKLMGEGPDYIIDSEWMNRVQEVVDYAYEEDVYVILNIHHEDQWLFLGDESAEKTATNILEKVWTQIAGRFQGYGHRLLFETMNETRLIGTEDEWTAGTHAARKTINKYNKAAVKAIRSTGGENSDRTIIIKTIGARYNVEAINDVDIPENDNHIILSVHIYEPYYFCMVPGRDAYWGTKEDEEALSLLIRSAVKAAENKGMPLIFGEFGTINKGNEESRVRYAAHFVRQVKENGASCILWDNNIPNNEFGYSIFDRQNLTWRHPRILKAIIDNS